MDRSRRSSVMSLPHLERSTCHAPVGAVAGRREGDGAGCATTRPNVVVTVMLCAAPDATGPRCGAPGPTAPLVVGPNGRGSAELTVAPGPVGRELVSCSRGDDCGISVVSGDVFACGTCRAGHVRRAAGCRLRPDPAGHRAGGRSAPRRDRGRAAPADPLVGGRRGSRTRDRRRRVCRPRRDRRRAAAGGRRGLFSALMSPGAGSGAVCLPEKPNREAGPMGTNVIEIEGLRKEYGAPTADGRDRRARPGRARGRGVRLPRAERIRARPRRSAASSGSSGRRRARCGCSAGRFPRASPSRCRQVGAIVESPALFPTMSGRDNLELLGAIDRIGRRRVERGARGGRAGRTGRRPVGSTRSACASGSRSRRRCSRTRRC